jgi:hypothetical protein
VPYLQLIVDRHKEFKILEDIIYRRREERIFHICDDGGKGKSFLLKAFKQKANELDCSCCLIEFRKDKLADPLMCMREFIDQLGSSHFPKFCEEDIKLHNFQPMIQIGGNEAHSDVSLGGSFRESEVSSIAGRDVITIEKLNVINNATSQERNIYIEQALTRVFKDEIIRLTKSQKILILLDAFENSLSHTIDWIFLNVLNMIRDGRFSQLIVVVAGRPGEHIDRFKPAVEWKTTLVDDRALGNLAEEDVATYFTVKRKIPLESSDLEAYYKICKSNPLIMAQIADILDV